MFLLTIRYIDDNGERMKYETEDREELDNFIMTLPEDILKQAYVYDPENRGCINAWVYIMGDKLMTFRILSTIFFILGGLPLLLTPLLIASYGMLYASIYDFGFSWTLAETIVFILVSIIIWSYPFTYIFCLLMTEKRKYSTVRLSIIPLVHFVVILVMFSLFEHLSNTYW